MLTDENIENLKRKIDDLKLRHISERKTREQLIDLTLRYLGWDVSNYKQVDTEYSIPGLKDNVRWVDYALLDEDGSPVVFVEAKRLSDDLGDSALGQLRHYGALRMLDVGTQNFAFLVLTNGNDWKFYHLWHEKGLKKYYGDWCYELNLERDDIPEIRDNLNNLLNRQNVLSGDSNEYLDKLFIQHRIKEIWESILSGRDETLVNLIENKMKEKGYKADREEIKEVILKRKVPRPVEVSPDKQGHENPPQPSASGTGKSPSSSIRWTILRAEYDGKIVEGGTEASVVLRNVLTLFADTCGGMGKVAEACEGLMTNPLVMTVEEAREFTRIRRSYRTGPFSDPKYSGYEYFFTIPNPDKKRRLEDLAKKLGISERVKVEVVDWVSQS